MLIAVSLAPQLALATAKATKMCDTIKFDGKQYRSDIAHKGISRYDGPTFLSCSKKMSLQSNFAIRNTNL